MVGIRHLRRDLRGVAEHPEPVGSQTRKSLRTSSAGWHRNFLDARCAHRGRVAADWRNTDQWLRRVATRIGDRVARHRRCEPGTPVDLLEEEGGGHPTAVAQLSAPPPIWRVLPYSRENTARHAI